MAYEQHSKLTAVLENSTIISIFISFEKQKKTNGRESEKVDGPFKCKYPRGTCALAEVSLAPSGGRRALNLHVIASVPTAWFCGNKAGF